MHEGLEDQHLTERKAYTKRVRKEKADSQNVPQQTIEKSETTPAEKQIRCESDNQTKLYIDKDPDLQVIHDSKQEADTETIF